MEVVVFVFVLSVVISFDGVHVVLSLVGEVDMVGFR